MDIESTLSAKEKLALSRAQLLGAMGYEEIVAEGGAGQDLALRATAEPRRSMLAKIGLGALGNWWTRHPLNTVVEMSRPVLESYAYRYPGRLVAYSAGVGGLLVILKPWRLLSLATVVTLLFKGSDIAATVTSLVGSAHAGTASDARDHLPPLG